MMKNLYLRVISILIISLFINVSGFSQGFEGGAMGGLLGSQVAGDPSSGYNKLGVYFGILAKRQFTLKSGAQLEMYYIQKGARENPTEENGFSSYLLRINNIEIPLLYLFTINEQLQLSVGVAYTYLLGEPNETFNESTSGISNAGFNKHSATFILGIEYYINKQLSVSFRTNNSITPIRPHVSGSTRFFNKGQYSDVLSLGLVYHFTQI